jgi:glycosyltransferase involved in cell wall biosynthesis
MRILHVVPSYFPATRYGGPIYSVHGLCKALVERGHEAHVFTTNVDGAGDSDVPLGRPVDLDGVKVWYFLSRRLRRVYWAPRMRAALFQQVAGFDIVHLHSVFLWPTWAAARAAQRAHVPYVLSPRGMLVRDLVRRKSRWAKTAWVTLIEGSNLAQAAAVHVTSGVEARELEAFGFRLPLVFEVANGVDEPEEWSPSRVSPRVRDVLAGDPFLVVLGRLSWKKGLDRALMALALVPEIPLVIAGNDDEKYTPTLRALAAKLGVAERVRFLGAVTGPDKEALLAGAAVVLLPSHNENFGNVVLEAMIRGIPVVATPEVGAGAVVQAAGAGRIARGEPDTLARAIQELLWEPQTRVACGEAGRAWVSRHYSWKAIGGHMEWWYEHLLEETSSGRPAVGTTFESSTKPFPHG